MISFEKKDYDSYVVFDDSKSIEYLDLNGDIIGWEKGQPISKEMADEAYGENYFHYMRIKMVELSVYSGARIKSSFDFGGHLDANVKD